MIRANQKVEIDPKIEYEVCTKITDLTVTKTTLDETINEIGV